MSEEQPKGKITSVDVDPHTLTLRWRVVHELPEITVIEVCQETFENADDMLTAYGQKSVEMMRAIW